MDYVNISLICIKIGRFFCVVFGRILLMEFVELLIFFLWLLIICVMLTMIKLIQSSFTQLEFFLEITLDKNRRKVISELEVINYIFFSSFAFRITRASF